MTAALVEDLVAVGRLLRRVIEETGYHEESWCCNSCDCGDGAPHKADCIVADAAHLMTIIVPDMCQEIEFWPRVEGTVPDEQTV